MYCSVLEMLGCARDLNAVDYFTYAGMVLSKKHYGKTKKYR
ncbi:MAG: hypothetical protein ACLSGN_07805 [Oscillospiraceae bacterium]